MLRIEQYKFFIILLVGFMGLASGSMASPLMTPQEFEKNIEQYLVKLVDDQKDLRANDLATCLVGYISKEPIHPYYSLTQICNEMENTTKLGTRGFVSSSTLLKNGLKLSRIPVVLAKMDDLKRLAFTIDGTPVVLHTNDLSELTKERVEKLLAVAHLKNIKVSMIVRGFSPSDQLLPAYIEASRLVQESGGVILSL